MSLKRALELAERGRGTTHPNPIVGCVLMRDGTVVGEAWHEVAGGPHAEVLALRQAGERARGATAYVTMEPCSHHGRTPPCTDALIEAGVAGVLVGALDPNPEVDGVSRLRKAGLEVAIEEGELAFRCRQQNEAWRVWISEQRPFVILKAAVTIDLRVTLPSSRWVSGQESRRRVHELRAGVDAVGVGMGTVRADNPQLTAREVGATRQPRRIAFGRGPLPDGSELELRAGALGEELRSLAGEGVQSLFLEGGPTIASSFLREGLVDKLLLFVAPWIAGEGPALLPEVDSPVRLEHVNVERVGDDVLLTAYIHEP